MKRLLVVVLASTIWLCACNSQTPQPTGLPAFEAPAVTVARPIIEQPEPEAPAPPRSPLAGRRICIDPGHDAVWAPGASARARNGSLAIHPSLGVPMHEHELTLSVAEHLQAFLETEGAHVCLTRLPRSQGGGVTRVPYDFNGDGLVRPTGRAIEDTPEVVQPRFDTANAFGAEVLLSIHFNGSSDPSLHGTEVYYSDGVSTAAVGRRLATSVLDAVLQALANAGHQTRNLGVKNDAYQRYSAADTQRLFATNRQTIVANGHDPGRCPDCYRLFTLGNNPMSRERGAYVAVLVEVEFLSHPPIVEGFLMRPDALEVIARGLFEGLQRYFTPD